MWVHPPSLGYDICTPVQALHCPVPLRSFVVVWNCYTKLARSRADGAILEIVINFVFRPVGRLGVLLA